MNVENIIELLQVIYEVLEENSSLRHIQDIIGGGSRYHIDIDLVISCGIVNRSY